MTGLIVSDAVMVRFGNTDTNRCQTFNDRRNYYNLNYVRDGKVKLKYVRWVKLGWVRFFLRINSGDQEQIQRAEIKGRDKGKQ